MEFLNYKTFGDKSNPPIVIIHGLFGTLDNWMTLSRHWSEDFFILALDVRNHGKSFHSEDMTFESISNDILNLMDHEGISKANVIGHSMGGKILMHLIENHIDRIDKPIIVDVAPYAYSPHHSYVFNMIDKINLEKCSNREEVNNEIIKYIDNPAVVAFMGKNIKRDEDNKFEWKFNAAVLKREYSYLITYVPKIGTEKEVLFIGGERSDYINTDTSVNMLNLYPNYNVDIIENAGHWVQADNPSKFSESVYNFINQ